MNKIIVPAILGPTATGKTDIALVLAEKRGYEILSCDSRQIYRGMDIGTAKPTIEEMGGVRHWLIDILSPSVPYSAFAFAAAALEIIRGAHKKGKKILICGGTGLYYNILVNGGVGGQLDETDLDLRGELEEEARLRGAGALHERLRGVDPAAALKIHPNDLQRILRALDIYYRKGRPLSSLQERGCPPEDIEFRAVVVERPRDILYERINRRVDAMLKRGLWNEFMALRGAGFTESDPGMVCVGYRELFDVERGLADIGRAAELIRQNTRRYAKRQMTWFRNKLKDAVRVEVSCDSDHVAGAIGDRLLL